MRHILCILMLWAAAHLTAQWSDPFDSVLDSQWRGDREQFIVNSEGRLQLHAKQAGRSTLWRPYSLADSLSWAFHIYLDFDPSATNKLEVFLLSDSLSLTPDTAIILEIGENGITDTWKIYAKQGVHKDLIASGQQGILATGPLAFKFHIICYSSVYWQLYLENLITGENQKLADFSFKLPDLHKFQYFGVHCLYSETRKQAFAFDNISVGYDSTRPLIIKHQILDAHTILFTFNETIDTLRSKQNSLFKLNYNGEHNGLEWLSPVHLKLKFNENLYASKKDTLFYQKVMDLFGNISKSEIYAFEINFIRSPKYLDLCITEIMCDPSPAWKLPDAEYIEIYNRTESDISLKSCLLYDESTAIELPDSVIRSSEYIILGNSSDAVAFSPFGKTIPLDKFPSLNNDGDVLSIRNEKSELVYEVEYTSQDFEDASKAEGGYALEWVSVFDLCALQGGWKFSKHPLGGTPGFQNSWLSNSYDSQGPQLLAVYPLSIWEIKLVFSEKLHPDIPNLTSFFKLNPTSSIATIEFTDKSNELLILLHQPLRAGQHYKIEIESISDCLGNLSEHLSFEFALGVDPEPGDVVWSEVLFDAYSSHHDFVEIYNRSNKYISLQKLELSDGLDSTKAYPLRIDKVLAPYQYLAMTSNATDLMGIYPIHNRVQIEEVEILPMEDNGASLFLTLNNGRERYTIDSFAFTKEWHHPFIKDPEGKSLEKIEMNLPSALRSSWQTAGHWVYFASPGLANSQSLKLDTVKKDKPYHLNSNRISPNGDGFEDFLGLMFKIDKPAYLCYLDLYNLSGQLMSPVYRDQVYDGQLVTWLGEDLDGSPLTAGNYILNINLAHPDGTKISFKERISLLR
ncbi:MAG: lamin tail domain-containing protein [Saprospiraceae bacterium]|nr:lamin tail domain-containing protein [Saprospiraceae bacterium]